MLAIQIQELFTQILTEKLGSDSSFTSPVINRTRPEFEGDYTLVVFPYLKALKQKPEQVAEILGQAAVEQSPWIESYNVVKGFLNLVIRSVEWQGFMNDWTIDASLPEPKSGKKVMVEFCSPNTNKPIHLGHMRNILLGWSTAQILKAAGNEVITTQIINDRGIAICKSMLAWKKFGENATPASTNIKGDFFVGHYYVLFETKFQEEYSAWQESKEGQDTYLEHKKEDEDTSTFYKRYKHEYFNRFSILGKEAKEMLLAWEARETEVVELWRQMNQWVYQGFEITYDKIGIDFDTIYYESDTYLLGKDICKEGLEKDVFFKKEDGSVWVDLSNAGMDHKIILRADGTALYITQDLGTAEVRYKEHHMDSAVYVVADEQDYHFQVLFEVLRRLDRPYADSLYHLSYGMVDLPTGKMKSREGKVVDADVLIEEIIEEAAANSKERGELDSLSQEEIKEVHRKVALGALKFFILKVNPKKRMTYDPKESLDMQGQTGPYIQNAYVRIASVIRKNDQDLSDESYDEPSDLEKQMIKDLMEYPAVIQEAAKNYDPSHVANYCYNLAKSYHKFYHDHRILTAETEGAKSFRISLSHKVRNVLKHAMNLLGIEMPEKM